MPKNSKKRNTRNHKRNTRNHKRNTRNRKRNTITRKRNTRKNYKRKSLRIKRKRQKGGGPDEGVWNSFLDAVGMIPIYANGPDDLGNGPDDLGNGPDDLGNGPDDLGNGPTNYCISLLDENNELPFFKIQAYNKTPLHYAIESGSKKLIYKVIETMNTFLNNKVQEHVYDQERADNRRKLYINMIGPNGSPLNTVIVHRKKFKTNEVPNIIETLRNNGADVNELFVENPDIFSPPDPEDPEEKQLPTPPEILEALLIQNGKSRPFPEAYVRFLQRSTHNKSFLDILYDHEEDEVPTTGVLTGVDDEAY